MTDARPLPDRYWYIAGNRAEPIDVAVPEFWNQLMSGDYKDPVVGQLAEADAWLIGAYDMTSDMEGSEMHPAGDEFHYLVSGRVGLVLEGEDGAEDEVIEMAPGTAAVVREGIWHRFLVREPADLLSATFGRGTEHRPQPR